MLPNAASLLISEGCNLACTYCFEEPRIFHENMSKEIAYLSVDMLVQNANKEKEESVTLTLFGGEPMINFPIIREVLDYLILKTKSKNLKPGATLITNGTICKDEHLEYFENIKDKLNFSIQLSLDGIPKVHDKYRIFPNGGPSSHITEKLLPKWLSLGVDYINVHGCYNKDTLQYLYESYVYFRNKGIRDIWFLPIPYLDYSLADVELYRSEMIKIKDYLVKEYQETKDEKLKKSYAPLDRAWNNSCEFSNPCGAGGNYVTVVANGDIYPCHDFYFNDPEHHTKIGDVYTGIDEQRRLIFTEYDSTDMSCHRESPDCENYSCYRCIADNFILSGSIFSNPSGLRCLISSVDREIMSLYKKEIEEGVKE